MPEPPTLPTDDRLLASPLHLARLDAVISALLDCGARSVLDLGCGRGVLLQRLRREPAFTRLLGLDIDRRALDQARESLGLDAFSRDTRLRVQHGSFETADASLCGFDAAVMLETIEHIDPSRLSRVERSVFGDMRPGSVLITTPNQEYNVLHGMAAGQRRHPGHRFEWTRAQFRRWAEGAGDRQGYAVEFSDLGPVDAARGSSTQMARFTRRGGAA